MVIRKRWLSASKYSLLEAAYLACGLEPQNRNADPPQIVLSVLREMNDEIVNKHPHLRGVSTKDVWFKIDFVRAWVDYIGETDFFNSEPAQIDKPLTESESERDKKLTKLEKQQQAILKVIDQKQFKPLKIPDGEKGKIELICKSDYPELFDGESSFNNAWKKSRSLFCMANYASYAKRGKD